MPGPPMRLPYMVPIESFKGSNGISYPSGLSSGSLYEVLDPKSPKGPREVAEVAVATSVSSNKSAGQT